MIAIIEILLVEVIFFAYRMQGYFWYHNVDMLEAFFENAGEKLQYLCGFSLPHQAGEDSEIVGSE